MKNSRSRLATNKQSNKCKARLKRKLENRKKTMEHVEPSLVSFLKKLYVQAQHSKACEENRTELLNVQQKWLNGEISRSDLQEKVHKIVNDRKNNTSMTTLSATSAKLSISEMNFVFTIDYLDTKLPDWLKWELSICKINEKIELFLAPKVQVFNLSSRKSVTLSDVFGDNVFKKISLNTTFDCFIFRFVIYFQSQDYSQLFLNDLLQQKSSKEASTSKSFLKSNIWSKKVTKLTSQKCSIKSLTSFSKLDDLSIKYFTIYKRFILISKLKEKQRQHFLKVLILIQRKYKKYLKPKPILLLQKPKLKNVLQVRREKSKTQPYESTKFAHRRNRTLSFASATTVDFEKFKNQTKNKIENRNITEVNKTCKKWELGLNLLTSEIIGLVSVLQEQVDRKSKEKQKLLYEMKRVLSNVFPCAKLSLFGSCASKLDLPESDVDCFYVHQGGEKGLRVCEKISASNKSPTQSYPEPHILMQKLAQKTKSTREDICLNVLEGIIQKIELEEIELQQIEEKRNIPYPLGTNHNWNGWPLLSVYHSTQQRYPFHYFPSQPPVYLNPFYTPPQYSLYEESISRQSPYFSNQVQTYLPQPKSYRSNRHLSSLGLNSCNLTEPILKQLDTLRNAFFEEDWVKGVNLVKAKIPVLRLKMCQTVDFERDHLCGKCFTADLSSGHSAGHTRHAAVNLLNAFQLEVKEFRPLMILLKKLLLSEKFHDPFRGGLGSFPLACLLMAFLRSNLSRSNEPEDETKACTSTSRHFYRSPTAWSAHHSKTRSVPTGKKSCGQTQSLGELFLNFLNFYGNVFDPKKIGVSVKGVKLGTKSVQYFYELPQTGHFSPIVVDNPFWPTKNVATGAYNICLIFKLFRLYFVKIEKILCAESEDKKSILRSVVSFKWGKNSKEQLMKQLENKVVLS